MSTRSRPSKSRGPGRRPTLLVLDEDWSTLEHIYEGLRNEYELTLIERASETLEVMERKPFDVLLTNARISGMELPDLVSQVKARHPKVHYVLMSTFSEVESTMSAMRLGVADYVRKPFNIGELRHVLARSMERSLLHQELDGLRSGPPSTLEGIIAHDERMREVCHLAETVAATDATVLLSGETGTGKGLVAQAVHNSSPRREGPYVEINCAAIPATLIESELFGHERGAFTGAVARKIGRVEAAAKGTLLLDEVGEMPLEMQAKMLHFLQEFSFERVGGNQKLTADVRVIAATNRDLSKAVKQGSFREDLFYRLHVIELHVPPLRERRDDILPLAQYFRERFAARYDKPVLDFSNAAKGQMMGHLWPGNVREMEHAVERAVILATAEVIERLELANSAPLNAPGPPPRAASQPAEPDPEQSLGDYMAACEKGYLRSQLERHRGRVNQTARAAGINPKTLYLKMNRHGLAKEDYRPVSAEPEP
ncbi:MAG: sigma-54 dependent transcriptional regulator [Desulfarculaceae bacterium]|nr:sigma-54 dependent transcriptional regulator [Desulfarculaceae bacterium]MCF8071949.1 sigma-54 dependent transcriptional regulator [Desulfarculaceae bacterium]MCF8101466.1 sigma-54 dependent transcriptional regulator [Desulfarculaceae bacterium]MCF8115016.1 sigma-54 dependent transcriptional regulator [Desulfarculaceae bacterium]